MSEQKKDRKFDARVLENLPETSTDIMDYWIHHPRELQDRLANLSGIPIPDFDVYMTITLGIAPIMANEIRNALEANGIHIYEAGMDMLNTGAYAKTSATEKTEVDVIQVSPVDFDFPKGASRARMYARAESFGLERFTAEAAVRARLKYKEQKPGEILYCAMEPIRCADGDNLIFGLVCKLVPNPEFVPKPDTDGLSNPEFVPKLELEAVVSSSDDLSSPTAKWLFIKPRKKTPPPISAASEHPVCSHFAVQQSTATAGK